MTAHLAWLIDANVVSEMMRPRPEPRVSTFLDSIEREGIGLASVTVWEILDGIGRLSPVGDERTLPAVSRTYSTNCSKIGSLTGPWPTPGRVRGPWRTSADVANRSTIMSRMPSLRPQQLRADSLS